MPELGSPRPQSPLDASHVSTSEWQSFELRMRRRRAERCVVRAEEALAAGDESAAAAALAEAHELSPHDTPDLETLRMRMAPPELVLAASSSDASPSAASLAGDAPADERQTPWLRAAAAAVVLVGLITAGFALSTRIERAPESVPASAAIEHPLPPPAAATSEPAAPASGAGLTAAADQRPDDVPAATPPVVPASTPLVVPEPREAEADLRRVAYTPPPPTVGTTGNEALPAMLGAPSPVPVAPPEPPPVALPEIPAVPLATASAPAGAAAVTAPPPPAPEPVEPRIRAVLSSYEAGFGALDASAVHRVWPGVDERSLARAFEGLASQSVSLGDCAISVRDDTASARCQGTTTWAPKVGGGSKTEARRWEFALRNAGGSWLIVRADVR